MEVSRDSSSRADLVLWLDGVGRTQRFEKNETIFHQGDPATAVFSVIEGRVRLDRHLADGRVATVAVVRAPGLLAEAALFADHYRCDATAETACILTRVPRSAVVAHLERDPAFALLFIRNLVSEVRALRTRLELRNVRPAAERLLRYLDLEAERARSGGDRPLSALADELGLTPEALYRVVARLEREGRLERDGRRLTRIS